MYNKTHYTQLFDRNWFQTLPHQAVLNLSHIIVAFTLGISINKPFQ